MRELRRTNAFKKDLRRSVKRGCSLAKLATILRTLQLGETLPAAARPHPLQGEWLGIWECHISPDWLLLYEISDNMINLIRTGTHSDLFE